MIIARVLKYVRLDCKTGTHARVLLESMCFVQWDPKKSGQVRTLLRRWVAPALIDPSLFYPLFLAHFGV